MLTPPRLAPGLMGVTIVHAPEYEVDLGPHVFPTTKYALVRARLLERGIVGPEAFVVPEPASWEELALVHTPAYLRRLRDGTLSLAELARLEIPWSPAIVEGFRLMTGGSVLAARTALAAGVAVNLGGGFHHAFPDHGEGFCLFNDVAVAIRVLQREQDLPRVAVVDCDVHQGNGTAAIFADDPRVFTVSLHQEHNYPAVKPPSDLDIGFEDGTDDSTYLAALDTALARVWEYRPALLVYLAGVDPFEDDLLGGLKVTRQGLRERDRRVLQGARARAVPVAVLLAGGYARRLEQTVALHVQTVEEAVGVTAG